ncbi:hypothetical protein ACWGA9_32380 [Streptomyces sp. NPDC054950]
MSSSFGQNCRVIGCSHWIVLRDIDDVGHSVQIHAQLDPPGRLLITGHQMRLLIAGACHQRYARNEGPVNYPVPETS